MVAHTYLPPLALSVNDAARYSGLSRTRLYTYMADGTLQSFLIGGRRMIYRAAIDELFAQFCTPPTPSNDNEA